MSVDRRYGKGSMTVSPQQYHNVGIPAHLRFTSILMIHFFRSKLS